MAPSLSGLARAAVVAVFATAGVLYARSDSPRDAPLGWGAAVGDVVHEYGPLWEPALRSYFAPLAESQATIPRERDISRARFEELAARGQPFIITDAGRDLALLGVSCDAYAAAWPNASMRAEYLDPAQTGDEWGIFRDEAEQENKIRLSNPLWWNTHRGAAQRRGSEHHTAAEELHGGGRGLAAPYIWHVKDQEPLPTKRSVQARWRVPYFARRPLLNAWEASESFEFWFSLPGGGTMAHGDAYCELTVSIQLRGKKRWRLMMMPAFEKATEALDTRDGGVYGSGLWAPEYDTVVGPGEAIVFPPSYLHETFVSPTDNPDGGCTVATTFQLSAPAPARFLRAFLPRLVAHAPGLNPPARSRVEGQAG